MLFQQQTGSMSKVKIQMQINLLGTNFLYDFSKWPALENFKQTIIHSSFYTFCTIEILINEKSISVFHSKILIHIQCTSEGAEFAKNGEPTVNMVHGNL